MKMTEQKFVVVTDAVREMLTNEYNIKGVRTESKQYKYRKGDLGLLHPNVVEPCKLGAHHYQEGDIPIVLYQGELLAGGWLKAYGKIPQNLEEYFIITLSKNEFERINGSSLHSVKNGIWDTYKSHGIELYCSKAMMSMEETLDATIENQYRHLMAFEVLMNGRIDEIPVEVMPRKISKEMIKREEYFRNKMEQMRRGRMHIA